MGSEMCIRDSLDDSKDERPSVQPLAKGEGVKCTWCAHTFKPVVWSVDLEKEESKRQKLLLKTTKPIVNTEDLDDSVPNDFVASKRKAPVGKPVNPEKTGYMGPIAARVLMKLLYA